MRLWLAIVTLLSFSALYHNLLCLADMVDSPVKAIAQNVKK